MIVSEEELHRLADGMTLIPANMCFNYNYARLDIEPEDFIRFCKDNETKCVFFRYNYYDKEEYIVTDELLQNYTESKEEYDYCKKWSTQWNERVDKVDFSLPRTLALVTAFQSMIITCLKADEWMPEDIPKAEDAFFAFRDEHEDDLFDLFEIDESGVTLADELEQVLINDPVFRNSTNKESRKIYLESFLKKKENKRFLKLVRDQKQSWQKEVALRAFVDRIYNQYRNRCYRLKIQVGDEIPDEE